MLERVNWPRQSLERAMVVHLGSRGAYPTLFVTERTMEVDLGGAVAQRHLVRLRCRLGVPPTPRAPLAV